MDWGWLFGGILFGILIFSAITGNLILFALSIVFFVIIAF